MSRQHTEVGWPVPFLVACNFPVVATRYLYAVGWTVGEHPNYDRKIRLELSTLYSAVKLSNNLATRSYRQGRRLDQQLTHAFASLGKGDLFCLCSSEIMSYDKCLKSQPDTNFQTFSKMKHQLTLKRRIFRDKNKLSSLLVSTNSKHLLC